jgi:uncharacterized protein
MMSKMNASPQSSDETANKLKIESADDAILINQIEAACDQACKSIAPAWPLDQAIAVNPHWSRIGFSVRQVAARMAVLGGIQVFPSRQSQQLAWAEGRIQQQDLDLAITNLPAAKWVGLTAQQCLAAFSTALKERQLPLLIDVLDNDPKRYRRLSWRQAITHQVSQTCAAYFDQNQADWQPDRSQGLYAFWRETLQNDHGIGLLMGLPKLSQALAELPETRLDAEYWVLQRLGLPQTVWADYLEAVLLTVNGWASWCAYLGWQAGLEGRSDTHLRELLAIRLCWGLILLNCKDDQAAAHAFNVLQQQWQQSTTQLKETEDALLIDEVWQVALEIGYQRSLAQKLLSRADAIDAQPEIIAQAAFCIDVRSEPLRHALEMTSNTIQTIGFAGFFGLPIAYTPLATAARRPQLPGLLHPTIEVTDRIISATGEDSTDTTQQDRAQQDRAQRQRLKRFGLSAQWLTTSRWPSSAFSFVEAAGFIYAGKLAKQLLRAQRTRERDDLHGLSAQYRSLSRPQIIGLDVNAKVSLAASILHAMGLDHNLAPLVLLIGHGSQSANNAQAAALDCGACCGQTGEVNARSLAQLLNEPDVRSGLRIQGIEIPEQTLFIAALHNTTTDEIEWFELDFLTPQALLHWEGLQPIFAQACHQVRTDRAQKLGVEPNLSQTQLLHQLRIRANDWAQTRPEWGLANNAAFIIAPRDRTCHINLEGRSFLHDYEQSRDPDGSVLEMLMTAPMLVTHWINWQYHASTCEPTRLGSGNKVLHNVVGGNIGVFEGNGGDLRIGLSRQSLHNGEQWMHEPLRLTVVIDAPQQTIDAIIHKHSTVQQLIDNDWIYLWRFDQEQLLQYRSGEWQPVSQAVA